MKSLKKIMDGINAKEETDISFCKVGNRARKLVVSFGGNGKPYFQRKSSLLLLRKERSDFDILYLRNRANWYLGGLNGVGKNIEHTISFLRKQFSKYDKVICTGNSAGGYASILFGSLLSVDVVVADRPQIDLEYCVERMEEDSIARNNLVKRKKECTATWNKYKKIDYILNGETAYYVHFEGDANCRDEHDLILHGDYHYNLIKNFQSVKCIDSKDDVIPKINENLDTTR